MWSFTYNGGRSGQDLETAFTATATVIATPMPVTLSYDFKGSVTSRTPLSGGKAHTYACDECDRLKSAAHGGQATIKYCHDAFGRPLDRD